MALASAFAASSPAQNDPQLEYIFWKRSAYDQTSATALSPRSFEFLASLTQSAWLPGYAPAARLNVGTASYSLPVSAATFPNIFSPVIVSQRSFATRDELERLFPTSAFSVLTITWNGGGRQTAFGLPAAPTAAQTPITNFDELQRWDGGPLAVSWRNVLGGALGGFPFTSLRSELSIHRTADPALVTSANRVIVQALAPAAGDRVVFASVAAAPGETLQGEITLSGADGKSQVLVRFPIRRLPAAGLAILSGPQGGILRPGERLALAVEAAGENLSYQWRKDGTALAGATRNSFEIAAVQPGDAGSYTVVVSSPAQSLESAPAVVQILQPPAVLPLSDRTVVAGVAVSFAAQAAGSAPLQFQWTRNGTAVPGATDRVFTLPAPRVADAGQYAVVVTNAAGTVSSPPARLVVEPVARIANLAIRSSVGGATDRLTIGFTVSGAAAAGPKPLLLRAVGPALAVLGVEGAQADPQLALLSGTTAIAQNDDWAGSPAVANLGAAVGAFALPSGTSKDAALVHQADAGGYTMQIAGRAPNGGVALAEIYDGTPSADFLIATPRLTNVSALTTVQTGGDILIAGFSIAGGSGRTILLRGIGPTLATFGVSGALNNPRIEVFQDGATRIAENDDWGSATNAAEIARTAAAVGAFALAPDSRDAALLLRLPPGSYTVQLSGVNDATGVGLVELYESPSGDDSGVAQAFGAAWRWRNRP